MRKTLVALSFAAGLGLFDDSHFKGLPQALRCLLSEG